MPRRRPLLLLPPSKRKSLGGDGPPLHGLPGGHPLAGPRGEVLRALATDVDAMRDTEVARLAGVPAARAPRQREQLRHLADAPTLPAHRRYTGVVHSNAGLADVQPHRLRIEVRIVSGLLGLVALDEPVPEYRVEVAATLPSLGGLGPFWRDALADHLAELGRGRRVWDLLPGEHRRVLAPVVGDRFDRVDVAFLRPDGGPANAARTKLAKGRLAAALMAEPAATPQVLARKVDLGPGWSLAASGSELTATYAG